MMALLSFCRSEDSVVFKLWFYLWNGIWSWACFNVRTFNMIRGENLNAYGFLKYKSMYTDFLFRIVGVAKCSNSREWWGLNLLRNIPYLLHWLYLLPATIHHPIMTLLAFCIHFLFSFVFVAAPNKVCGM